MHIVIRSLELRAQDEKLAFQKKQEQRNAARNAYMNSKN